MSWNVTDDWGRYLAEAGAFLRADPVENTVSLSVIESLRAGGTDVFGPDPLFGWWSGADGVGGAFLQTGTFPLLLSAMPERLAESLAETLSGEAAGLVLPGVNAEAGAARAFAAEWSRRTGAVASVHMRQRLYRLEGLKMPAPPPGGKARVAGMADVSLVSAWFAAFERDAGAAGTVNPKLVEDRLSNGRVLLWEVEGEPVSLAGRTPTVAGVSRIGPVYTPTSHRRRGYGAAVTAELTKAILDAGADHAVLFTDLANPTSNGVYQRIGYRPVSDRLVLDFAAG
jgi:predicted GNAT family acetyltransferase